MSRAQSVELLSVFSSQLVVPGGSAGLQPPGPALQRGYRGGLGRSTGAPVTAGQQGACGSYEDRSAARSVRFVRTAWDFVRNHGARFLDLE